MKAPGSSLSLPKNIDIHKIVKIEKQAEKPAICIVEVDLSDTCNLLIKFIFLSYKWIVFN